MLEYSCSYDTTTLDSVTNHVNDSRSYVNILFFFLFLGFILLLCCCRASFFSILFLNFDFILLFSLVKLSFRWVDIILKSNSSITNIYLSYSTFEIGISFYVIFCSHYMIIFRLLVIAFIVLSPHIHSLSKLSSDWMSKFIYLFRFLFLLALFTSFHWIIDTLNISTLV